MYKDKLTYNYYRANIFFQFKSFIVEYHDPISYYIFLFY